MSEKSVSLKQLLLQSIYVETLLEKGELSKIHDIIPDPEEVVEAWKLVKSKFRMEIQDCILTFVRAYIAINHEDIDELEPFLVGIIFLTKNTEHNIRNAIKLLAKICHDNSKSTLDSINAYHRFRKNKRDQLLGIDSRNRDVLYLFNRIFSLIQNDSLFSDSSKEIIQNCLTYVFTVNAEDEIDDDDVNFEDMELRTDDMGFSLKDIIEKALGSNVIYLRSNVIQLLTSMCFISESYARKFIPVIEKEVYYQKKEMQAFALASLMDVFFIWPSLLNMEEDEEVSSKLLLYKHFMNAPEKEKKMQTIFIHGVARLLLNDCLGKDYVEGLDLLCSKYVSVFTQKPVKELILLFLNAYNNKKMSHQKEIGNTVVSILVEDIGMTLEKEEEIDDEDEDEVIESNRRNVTITETAKGKIVLLLSFLQSKHYPKVVENAQMNLEKVLGRKFDPTLIQKWFNLK